MRSQAKRCGEYVFHRTLSVTRAACGRIASWFHTYAPRSVKNLVTATQQAARVVRDWTFPRLTWLRPSFVSGLQDTSRQVDRALAKYEARRKAAAGLLGEARKVKAELAEQIEANRQATIEAEQRLTPSAEADDLQYALAQRQQSEQAVACLQTQHDRQHRYVEELEQQLTKTDATLARLRSQRDVLSARLQAVQARLAMEAADVPKCAARDLRQE